MKSFFGSTASKAPASNRNTNISSGSEISQPEKRKESSSVSPPFQNASAKKQKSLGQANKKSTAPKISSFFGVRGTM
jgi:hypothetical protein